MPQKPNLVTEIAEDGTEQIVESDRPVNQMYDMNIERANENDLPEAPPITDLSKLFKPKYILNITVPDGSIIPFTYKKQDPGSLLLSHGSPLAIDTEIVKSAQEIQSKIDEVQEGENAEELLQELMTDPKFIEMHNAGMRMRKTTIQTCVISPIIDDALYNELDDAILEALYQAITGGVTNQAELVEHFRETNEDATL